MLRLWKLLQRYPGGSTIFTLLIRRFVPYSASVRPRVLHLEPGRARIAIADSRKVRNHLKSVHAIAITNVAELASGLAMTTALPARTRGIVLRLSIEFQKKGRGTLVAECVCSPPVVREPTEFQISSVVTDQHGATVATATVTWLLDTKGNEEIR